MGTAFKKWYPTLELYAGDEVTADNQYVLMHVGRELIREAERYGFTHVCRDSVNYYHGPHGRVWVGNGTPEYHRSRYCQVLVQAWRLLIDIGCEPEIHEYMSKSRDQAKGLRLSPIVGSMYLLFAEEPDYRKVVRKLNGIRRL